MKRFIEEAGMERLIESLYDGHISPSEFSEGLALHRLHQLADRNRYLGSCDGDDDSVGDTEPL